jgi:hypothetical protein
MERSDDATAAGIPDSDCATLMALPGSADDGNTSNLIEDVKIVDLDSPIAPGDSFFAEPEPKQRQPTTLGLPDEMGGSKSESID